MLLRSMELGRKGLCFVFGTNFLGLHSLILPFKRGLFVSFRMFGKPDVAVADAKLIERLLYLCDLTVVVANWLLSVDCPPLF